MLRPAPQPGHITHVPGLKTGHPISPGSQGAGGAWVVGHMEAHLPHLTVLGSGLLPASEMRLPIGGAGGAQTSLGVLKPERPWPFLGSGRAQEAPFQDAASVGSPTEQSLPQILPWQGWVQIGLAVLGGGVTSCRSPTWLKEGRYQHLRISSGLQGSHLLCVPHANQEERHEGRRSVFSLL